MPVFVYRTYREQQQKKPKHNIFGSRLLDGAPNSKRADKKGFLTKYAQWLFNKREALACVGQYQAQSFEGPDTTTPNIMTCRNHSIDRTRVLIVTLYKPVF